MLATIIIAGVFGAIYGSFLNVLLWRLPEGESIGGRSHCRHCKQTLAWHDLVPIFSYLVLNGRCRQCGAPIARRYPIVEAVSAAAFAGWTAGAPTDITLNFLGLAGVILLVSIFFFDLFYFTIPDAFVIPAMILFGAYDLYTRNGPALAAALLMAVFFGILYWVSQGAWLGFGDVKLVLALGLLLPYPQSVETVIVAIWLGGAVGIVLLARQRASRKTPLPMGSFLAAAAYLFLILGHALSFFQPIFR